ncbi:hypothetical protein M3223_20095 [Paenibacillus pasadenensis]|nr:hypothetical protein [Paenibacillus pasadenensis]MCM3749657.1 hypothetical protein [Paenibacillus pasadenensis]
MADPKQPPAPGVSPALDTKEDQALRLARQLLLLHRNAFRKLSERS